MVSKKDLLVEIGTEELPPLALVKLSQAFGELFGKQLQENGLGHGDVELFATPRRLALRVSDLDAAQEDRLLVRRGPAIRAAFDNDGLPTKAALGFARSCGVTVDQLGRERSDKGEWLSFEKREQGKRTEILLPAMVEKALGDLPIPKRMRWSDWEAEFVRPVHCVVLLFGNQVVEARILGIETGRHTHGHRFHHPELIALKEPKDYEKTLEETGKVIADFSERRERILRLATEAADGIQAKARIDPGLLDEVTALCEWPVAVLGSFDEVFLEVPPEVLVETMQKNQKYFPVVGAEGELKPNFITISNLESLDPAQVRAGNERVIRPRFKDAAFFWEQDLKRPLETLSESLRKVVFQERLGTVKDKADRIAAIAGGIAGRIGLEVDIAQRAASLCKCDLLTDMVGEFPKLQGVMGRYYAEAAGEDPRVSNAMEEHYLPRYSGDSLPASACGQALAIADRIDSLVGIFAVGLKPTGMKDPYGLRRAAFGVLRILIETPLHLDLQELINQSAAALAAKLDANEVKEEVFEYLLERLHAYYGEKGVPADVVESVLAKRLSIPADIDRRIDAVMHFRGMEEAKSLAAANKRILNILRKSEVRTSGEVDSELLDDESELSLHRQMTEMKSDIDRLMETRDYRQTLERLATLKDSVDGFFEQVMVNCEDDALRINRHRLLLQVSGLFLQVADISKLQ